MNESDREMLYSTIQFNAILIQQTISLVNLKFYLSIRSEIYLRRKLPVTINLHTFQNGRLESYCSTRFGDLH